MCSVHVERIISANQIDMHSNTNDTMIHMQLNFINTNKGTEPSVHYTVHIYI